MSNESIIGIVSGIFGIFAGIVLIVELFIKLKKWWKKRNELPPMSSIFDQIMDKKLHDHERRVLLRKLNKYPLLNNRIKENYITDFELNKRGREDVVIDICDSNDIELTNDICKELLTYGSPSLITKYKNIRQMHKAADQPPLIETNNTEKETIKTEKVGEQTVYLSDLLKTKHPVICQNLIEIFEKHNVKYSFIEGTNDIWCRDYMPIQIHTGKLIQFRYEPSYLKGKKEYEDSRSDVDKICKINHLDVEKSNINLDGGNVLMCDRRAILSDRIYSENPDIPREELRKELARLLDCEIIVIPSLNKTVDFTGHADGMVRFVNRNTVLGIKYDDKYKKDWWKNTQKVLDANNISFIEVPFFEDEPDPEHPESAIGVYVNYLEVNDLIVLPVFGRDEDEQMVSILKEQFPGKAIEKINYNAIAKEGGLLNCTTWVRKL